MKSNLKHYCNKVFPKSTAIRTSSNRNSDNLPFDHVDHIFPRIRERNAYTLLGVHKASCPEEIIDAKNYLIEQYKYHDPSREAIESAYEEVVLNKPWRTRLKHGKTQKNNFTGRIESRENKYGPLGRLGALFEPTPTAATLLNNGSQYLAIAMWAIAQSWTKSEIILPTLTSFGYSVYRMFKKRNIKHSEGSRSVALALFGALGYVCLASAFGGCIAALYINSNISTNCSVTLVKSLSIIFAHFTLVSFCR